MTTHTSNSFGKQLAQATLGALAGAVAIVPLLAFGGPALTAGGTGAIALAGVGVIYVLLGAGVGLGTLVPKPGAKLLNVAGPEDLADQRSSLLGGAASCLAIGLSLVVLAFAGPVGVVPAPLALMALAVMALIVGIVAMAERRREDEMARLVSHEAAAVCMTLGLPVLLGWAALDYLDRAAPIDPLWLIAGLAALLLLGSFIAAGRRGLLKST